MFIHFVNILSFIDELKEVLLQEAEARRRAEREYQAIRGIYLLAFYILIIIVHNFYFIAIICIYLLVSSIVIILLYNFYFEMYILSVWCVNKICR